MFWVGDYSIGRPESLYGQAHVSRIPWRVDDGGRRQAVRLGPTSGSLLVCFDPLRKADIRDRGMYRYSSSRVLLKRGLAIRYKGPYPIASTTELLPI